MKLNDTQIIVSILKRLGWTQREIGEMFGMKQPSVNENIGKLKQFNSAILTDFYTKRKPVEEIAEYYHVGYLS